MSLIRRNAKRDAAEPAIVAALEAVSAIVQPLSIKHWPDLLVLFRGQMYLLECKTGKRVRKDQEGQQKQIALLQALGYRVAVVRTPEDALQAVGAHH